MVPDRTAPWITSAATSRNRDGPGLFRGRRALPQTVRTFAS